jgi:signal transduction histidine kinase
MKNWRIAFFIIIAFSFGFSQKQLLSKVKKLHQIGAYEEGCSQLSSIDPTNLDDIGKAKFLYHRAICTINLEGEMVEAYKMLLDAKRLVNSEDLYLLQEINDELIYTQLSLGVTELSTKDLMDENCSIAVETGDPGFLIDCNNYKFQQISSDDPQVFDKQLALLHNSSMVAASNDLQVSLKNNEMNIASTHNNAKNHDSALIYFKRVKEYVDSKDYLPTKIAYYINVGFTYYELEEYVEAIKNYNIALDLSNQDATLTYRADILMNLSHAYEKNGDYKKAISASNRLIDYNDSLNKTEKFKAVQELEAKYQVQERKLENAQLTADNERQKVMIISIAGSTFVLLLGGLFVYKNQDKKRRLALQETEIEKQRADNLMKNQELATIDAMIAGQEKERKRLAEELHDNLGSSLTTIRLYFENLKNHLSDTDSNEIYSKTGLLLDETYAEIRNMSHRRASGVMASKGLIPSIQSLAQRLSASDSMQVEVHSHNMERQLENSLELTIFRIVQELLSNIVKHAQATHVVVNLLGNEKDIHIMVEDNGKGFNYNASDTSTGLGLRSIEQRIEKLGGNLEVDSRPGHGATISLEIPFV